MPIRRPRRAARGRVAAIAAVGATLGVLLTGCVGAPAPTPTSTPTEGSTAAPIFASDEEALAAAEAAYNAYGQASSEIAAEGGVSPERIDTTVTSTYAAELHEEFSALASAGLRMTGVISIDTISLAESGQDERGAYVSLFFCRDVSAVRVLSSDGVDVTTDDREARTPTQAFFVSSPEAATTLLVDGVNRWSGDNFC